MGGAGCVLGGGLLVAESTFGADVSRSFVDINNFHFRLDQAAKGQINQGFERTQALGGSSEFMRGIRRLL